MIRQITLAAGLTLAFMTLGCDEYQPPKVTFRDVDLVNVNADGMTIDFHIEIYNPNPVAVPLQQADYTLRIGNVQILRGRARPPGTLPANGTLQISLPVSLTWQNVLSAEETIRHQGGDIPYTFDGTLTFDVHQLRLDQPARLEMHYSGTLPIRQVLRDPSLLLRSPALRRLAQIVLDQVFNRPTQSRPAPPPQP